MVTYDDCGNIIPDPSCVNCTTPELARVRVFGTVKNTYLDTLMADPTDATLWTTGITNKDIYMFPVASGEFDGGTPIIKPGYGDLHERLVGYTFKLTGNDPNYISNATHWNVIKKQTDRVPFFASETQVNIATKAATIIPKAPVANDDQGEVVWTVEMSWVDSELPLPFDRPADVFVCD